MIFRRGGYGELSVSVNGEVDQPNEPSQSPTKFQITVVEATESIGIAINENAGSDSPLHVDVKRCDVEIDRRFAVAIQRVWATMILGTRQPKQNATIVGGYVADFSVRVGGAGTLRGMTRTPLRGLPKEFIEIGLELAGYCKLKVGECPKARKEILAHLASFERRARAAY